MEEIMNKKPLSYDEKPPLHILGAELAKLSVEIWAVLPDDEKKQIKKKFDVHHGEIGVLLKVVGHILSGLSSSLSEKGKREFLEGFGEALEGFGETLIIDDIQDISKWFKSRSKQP